jgi:hypothetical protein
VRGDDVRGEAPDGGRRGALVPRRAEGAGPDGRGGAALPGGRRSLRRLLGGARARPRDRRRARVVRLRRAGRERRAPGADGHGQDLPRPRPGEGGVQGGASGRATCAGPTSRTSGARAASGRAQSASS